MNCKFKYLNESNEWTIFGQVVAPLTIGDTIKTEMSSAYGIRLYFKGSLEITKAALTPGTICMIDFGTKQFHYVIIDGGKLENQATQDFCYHSYSIQELLAYTREIFIQPAFFSYNNYTFIEFFSRLLALSNSDRTIQIDQTTGDYTKLAERWKKPEYQIASTSLLDNLIKVGQVNQMRVKAKISTDNTKINLYFRDLKGSRTITSINGTIANKDNQYLGVNYGSKVAGVFMNLSNEKMAWFPEIRATNGIKVEPENGGATITPESAVLKLPYKIKNADKLNVAGFGKIITNSNIRLVAVDDYRVFYPDGTRIYPDAGKYVNVDWNIPTLNGNDLELEIMPYDNWAILDPDDTYLAEKHQENTLYFKQQEDKIFNMKICDGDGRVLGATPIGYYEVWYGGVKQSTTQIYPKFYWHRNKYAARSSIYLDALINIENNTNSKRTMAYNQEDNIVGANSLISNLNNYIESMKNSEESYTYHFQSIDDIPEVGDIYNGKVISEILLNANYDKIDASIILSDELVKKSEYLSADAGLNLQSINPEKAFNRYSNYKTKMWICKNAQEAMNIIVSDTLDNKYNKLNYYEKLLDAIKNGRTAQAIGFAYAEIKLGNIYTSKPVNTMVAGNIMIIAFKTLNNKSIGYIQDETLGSDYQDMKYYPVAFTNGEKQQTLEVNFKTIRAASANFPAISQSDFENTLGLIGYIKDTNYHLDPAEIINMVYQIEAKTTWSNGRVTKEYWEESGLLNDLYSYQDQYTRYFSWYYITQSGVRDYVFGQSVLISSVSITYPYTGIAKVSIGVPSLLIPDGFTAPAGEQNNSYLIIKRRNNSTLEEEIMLETKCEISGVGATFYINYYVALTKEK